ncbi:MAG: peptidylprolyl isomerase [Melioribacteraceae bacterium]
MKTNLLLIRESWFIKFVLFYFLTSLLIQAQSKIHNTVLAEIDNSYQVRFADVQNYFNEYHFVYLYRPAGKGYKAALEQIVTKRLKVIDFFNKNLDKKKLSFDFRRRYADELVNEYYKTKYYNKYINDSTIINEYRKVNKKVFYQQIVLKKDSTSQHALDSLNALADSIKSLFLSGNDDKIYSLIGDTSSFKTVLSLSWEQSYTDNLKFLIFNFPENSAYILEDENALYVIKVNDVVYDESEPLQDIKDKIVKKLELYYASKAVAEFQLELQRLVDEKSIQWNLEGLSRIVEWSKVPKFYEQTYIDTIQKVINLGKNFLIAQLPEQTVDLKKFFYLLNEVLMIRKQNDITENDIKSYIREALSMDIIVNKCKSLGIDKNIFNPLTQNLVLVDEIVKLYNEAIIESQIPEKTEKSLKQFYENNKDSLYYQLAQSNIYIALAPDTNKINEFKKKLAEGIPFEKINNRILVRRIFRERNGNIKLEQSDVSEEIGKAALNLNLGEVAGPFEFYDKERGKMYALIKCVFKNEEKQLTYDEVKSKIENDFKNYHRERIEKKVLKELEKLYNTKIYYDRLDGCLSELKILR